MTAATRRFLLLPLAGGLLAALLAGGCRGGEPPRPAAAPAAAAAAPMPEASPVDGSGAALLAQLQATPTRTVRVIATLKAGSAAKDQVQAALQRAGAQPLQDLAPQPLVVIEVNAAQLQAVLATAQVLRVQTDSASPTQ